MRKIILTAALLAPSFALAERVECTLRTPCGGQTACLPKPTTLAFEIDHNQFAPAFDRNEAPRRKVTTVSMGDTAFAAEPIVMQGRRGFWAEHGNVSHLLTVEQDGSAVYSQMPQGKKLAGTCTVGN